MSEKRKEKEIIEIESTEGTAVEERHEDEIVEKKPNRVLSVAKKLAPFAVLGGVIAAAFALGKSSGSDAAYLELMNDGYAGECGEAGDMVDETDEDPDQKDNSQTE